MNNMAHSNTKQFGSRRLVSIVAAIAASVFLAFAVPPLSG
jgi:hypothetical protein